MTRQGRSKMDNNQRMILWSTAWTLIAGMLVCGRCMKSQCITDSHLSFPHEPTCQAKETVAQMPWAELHEILDHERG
jgi:hypothetical protein